MGNIPPSALRRPPPPPPRHCSNTVPAPATSKAEGDKLGVRSRPLYLRRRKNSMIESLPDELLIEILLHLSANDIYENARLVCHRWRHLIHSVAFVHAHFHRASSGLLLESRTGAQVESSTILVTATTNGGVEISKLSCRLKFPILCSCNGLALSLRYRSRGVEMAPFIFNPATKCAFDLPRFPAPVTEQVTHRLGMAYTADSMVYKVFGSYFSSERTHFVVLTVGVDNAWRHVAVEGLSNQSKWFITGLHGIYRAPLTAGCFLHWVSEKQVVSLNVETEIFTETPFPVNTFPREVFNLNCSHLSTGEYLSLLIRRGDWSWEVWEMKPETWEWRNVLPNLDLEARKCKIQQLASAKGDVLKPVGWVRYPEVLAFFFNGRYCVIYNLDTEEFESIELSTIVNNHRAVQHRSSLLWSERC